MTPPRRDDRDDRDHDHPDEHVPEDFEMTREERLSYTYFTGRQDGYREANLHHRVTNVEGRVTTIEQNLAKGVHYLLFALLGICAQFGLMLIGLVTHFLTK